MNSRFIATYRLNTDTIIMKPLQLHNEVLLREDVFSEMLLLRIDTRYTEKENYSNSHDD